jgi:hypothetical protein
LERRRPSRRRRLVKSGHLKRSGNLGKAAREQLTLIRIFEELRALGHEGGYDAVRRYAGSWAKTRGSAAVEA